KSSYFPDSTVLGNHQIAWAGDDLRRFVELPFRDVKALVPRDCTVIPKVHPCNQEWAMSLKIGMPEPAPADTPLDVEQPTHRLMRPRAHFSCHTRGGPRRIEGVPIQCGASTLARLA